MPDQITIGWNAIAMVLDLPVEEVKNVVKAAGVSTWMYQNRVHAYTKDLVKLKEETGDNLWHIRLNGDTVVVFRGAVMGKWNQRNNVMAFYRQGLKIEDKPIDGRPFKDFLIKVQEIPL